MNDIKVKKRRKISISVLSLVLCIMMLIGIILTPSFNIKDTAAAPTPGTDEYYTERMEYGKTKLGWKDIGDSFTDYSGAAATVSLAGPWMLEGLDTMYNSGTISAPWTGAVTLPTVTFNGGTYNATTNPYLVYTAEEFAYCVAYSRSFYLKKDIDMNGYAGKSWSGNSSNLVSGVDGCGHTVYNVFIYTTQQISGFGMWNGGTPFIQNLNISNSYSQLICPSIENIKDMVDRKSVV